MDNTKPQVGDSLLIRHRSVVKANGLARSEISKYQDSGYISQVYADGTVATKSGDMYTVAPSKDGKHKWHTTS